MDAFILAGGAAKGAFEAGVLAGLLDGGAKLEPGRIVAVSSGALNGAFLAASVRNGTERHAGAALARIWLEEGGVSNILQPSVRGLLAGDGFSTGVKVLALLRRHIHPSTARHPVSLQIVVANLAGEVACVGPRPTTTFEHVLSFDGSTFDDEAGLERLFGAVVAATAFPFVFRPVALPIGPGGVLAPCIDGGAVNNTPVKSALADPGVTRVFLAAPFPEVVPPGAPSLHGLGLLMHLADVLVNERLYRDLRDAHDQNLALERLAALPPHARDLALEALGWTHRRRVRIIEMRPHAPLEGNVFAGLLSRSLRESYIRAGTEVAKEWARAQGK